MIQVVLDTGEHITRQSYVVPFEEEVRPLGI